MSHIFEDSPSRGPPAGRRRDILNQKYDHIGVCLDAILSRAEKGMEEIRIAVAEAREAVEQRRHLILRNNVDEDDLDVNVINDQGAQFLLGIVGKLSPGLRIGDPLNGSPTPEGS